MTTFRTHMGDDLPDQNRYQFENMRPSDMSINSQTNDLLNL